MGTVSMLGPMLGEHRKSWTSIALTHSNFKQTSRELPHGNVSLQACAPVFCAQLPLSSHSLVS
jgi:hypothetical protein